MDMLSELLYTRMEQLSPGSCREFFDVRYTTNMRIRAENKRCK